jgi:hypothetical protein
VPCSPYRPLGSGEPGRPRRPGGTGGPTTVSEEMVVLVVLINASVWVTVLNILLSNSLFVIGGILLFAIRDVV